MSYMINWPHSTAGVKLTGKSGNVYVTDAYGNFECPEADARGFMAEFGPVGAQCWPPLPAKAAKPAPKAAKPVVKAEKKVEKKAAPVKKSSAPKKSAKKAPAKKSSSKKG